MATHVALFTSVACQARCKIVAAQTTNQQKKKNGNKNRWANTKATDKRIANLNVNRKIASTRPSHCSPTHCNPLSFHNRQSLTHANNDAAKCYVAVIFRLQLCNFLHSKCIHMFILSIRIGILDRHPKKHA